MDEKLDILRERTMGLMKMKKIEPTPEDWERVKTRLEEEDPRHALMERLVQHEASERVARERAERRRRLLNRFSLGLLARG